MPDYRRHRLAGATAFFTVNLLDRNGTLLIDHIGALRQTVARVRTTTCTASGPCRRKTVTSRNDGTPSKWASREKYPPGESLSANRRTRGERGIWQRRFWEHTIRNERDYATHLDYIHFNPVKYGYVTHPADW